jgi:hypothetical protein
MSSKKITELDRVTTVDSLDLLNVVTNPATSPDNYAITVENFITSSGGVNYAQVVTVAKSGGDFTSIQDAIDSITDATALKRYVVRVMPGDYAESVVMKDYVDILGSGRTNSRITGTSGTVLTYPATKGTVLDMGIYVDYGVLGANSSAVVSAGADSVMIRCDVTVTKSGGDFVMHSFEVTGGAYRMLDTYHFYSITGATVGAGLTQSAILQSGALTTFLIYNCEITVTSDDANDDLVGFETVSGGIGTYLVANNIINVNAGAAGASATGLWLYGTASGATIAQNRITVNCNASSYGIWIDSVAGGATVNTRHNEIIVTAVGAAVAGHVEPGDFWNSTFDKVTAKTATSGAGTIQFVSSDIDGGMSIIQGDTTGAVPTLRLNQRDQDYVLVQIIGYADAGSADRTLVADADYGTPGALVGWIQIEIQDDGNRVADGDYYIPFYAAPT